jgi:hypothetical protein
VNVTVSVFRPAVITVPVAGLYTNTPGIEVVAFNSAELSAVPGGIETGFGHTITGVPFVTTRFTVAVAVVYAFVSVGVNINVRTFVPRFSVAPAAGLYVNVPGTDAVAFNCAGLSAVP